MADPDLPRTKSLLCGRCDHVLAQAHDVIEVAGASVHHGMRNQGGHSFDVLCVSHAPGCIAAGQASRDHAWFSGCTWQRAFCRGCTWHVGWLFLSPRQVFLGLDMARAIDEPR